MPSYKQSSGIHDISCGIPKGIDIPSEFMMRKRLRQRGFRLVGIFSKGNYDRCPADDDSHNLLERNKSTLEQTYRQLKGLENQQRWCLYFEFLIVICWVWICWLFRWLNTGWIWWVPPEKNHVDFSIGCKLRICLHVSATAINQERWFASGSQTVYFNRAYMIFKYIHTCPLSTNDDTTKMLLGRRRLVTCFFLGW